MTSYNLHVFDQRYNSPHLWLAIAKDEGAAIVRAHEILMENPGNYKVEVLDDQGAHLALLSKPANDVATSRF